ncbi:thiamine biosynthetic bifunctional enzyme Thi4 [Crepidotus variabilis]|uniref:Thiamine biosynthetic bifunctional enzyme Thi4 n=1 Tax=Crepidotus variabilis TaxID=179855 RepID=A0A9P6ECL6_9AGAR|nr:thiamine biosynthetic bifunctional enzyme Thi4 [Crepidotus variabilis]
MKRKDIDYSLYLVTARHLLPPNKAFLESLEEAIVGGVTIVQLREKDVDSREFLEQAELCKTVCEKHGVSLIINDRVDVAVAIGADGVHLGQTDMKVAQARMMLPEGSIIGVSCNTVEHVRAAVLDDVDYIGIGSIWGTQTKKLTNPVIGVRGVGPMLEALDGTNIKAIAIGGVKSTNLLRTLYGAVSATNHKLDGIAVVSDIIASKEPLNAAKALKTILSGFQSRGITSMPTRSLTPEILLDGVSHLMEEIRKKVPLVHQITNTVVQTQSANVTLAIGASPIMATEPTEMEDLARFCGSVLINIGTMRADVVESMILAGRAANKFHKPIVLDPVGVGATSFRKNSVKVLLDEWQVGVIKGNAGELAALAGTSEVKSRGVDSVGLGFSDPVAFVRNLARRERCTVVLTGSTDYISDGVCVVGLKNGNEVLGKITGAGCILGSCIASFCAISAQLSESSEAGHLVQGDMFIAAITGVLVLTVAADIAMEKPEVCGPGTFLPGLIDVLWSLTPAQLRGAAKISVL